MKKTLFTFLACLVASFAYAGSILIEGFEYANHDETSPIGWTCDDDSWLCGFHEKDHNRIPHTGNWYAFSNADESWMYMPLYLIPSMRYRFTCWAISDGSFQLEFWAGGSPDPNGMTVNLMSVTVESGAYEKFSAYVQTIPAGCNYVGVRAVAGSGATYLTIDDVEIDMVEEYDFAVHEVNNDTVLYPGTQATFHYYVENLGYTYLYMHMSPSYEYFEDIEFYHNGQTGTNFYIYPDETVYVTATATLRPDIAPGTISWLDIVFTIPCDCATGLATFWVTPLGTVDEFPLREHFDDLSHQRKGWVVTGNNPVRWEWATDAIEEENGLMTFRASETDGTSLLFSPKVLLNESDNLIRLQLYRTAEMPDKDDRINVYYNTGMTLLGADLIGTLHRGINRAPIADEEGWYEYDLNFNCDNPEGFLILQAVGDMGSDLYIDEILIDNTPLAIPENGHNTANVSVFPNPTSKYATITAEGLQQVVLMDETGRRIKSLNAQGDSLQMDLETLPNGLYFIMAITNDGTRTLTLAKQ